MYWGDDVVTLREQSLRGTDRFSQAICSVHEEEEPSPKRSPKRKQHQKKKSSEGESDVHKEKAKRRSEEQPDEEAMVAVALKNSQDYGTNQEVVEEEEEETPQETWRDRKKREKVDTALAGCTTVHVSVYLPGTGSMHKSLDTNIYILLLSRAYVVGWCFGALSHTHGSLCLHCMIVCRQGTRPRCSHAVYHTPVYQMTYWSGEWEAGLCSGPPSPHSISSFISSPPP